MTFDQALDHFKSVSAIAKALGVKPPSVSEWKARGAIPPVRQFQIEVVTAGALRADRVESSAREEAA